MKNFICVLIFAVCNLYAGGDAMFGLIFGQTPKEIRDKGITLVFEKADYNFTIYSCVSLPKNFSTVEKYHLVFSDDSLVKITMLTKDITNDIYGSNGKKQYEETFNLLKKKYTLDVSTMVTGLKVYDEPDEFYECLKYDGCGAFGAIFKNPTKAVLLELKGSGRGVGYIRMGVEAVPEFDQAADKNAKAVQNNNIDAF